MRVEEPTVLAGPSPVRETMVAGAIRHTKVPVGSLPDHALQAINTRLRGHGELPLSMAEYLAWLNSRPWCLPIYEPQITPLTPIRQGFLYPLPQIPELDINAFQLSYLWQLYHDGPPALNVAWNKYLSDCWKGDAGLRAHFASLDDLMDITRRVAGSPYHRPMFIQGEPLRLLPFDPIHAITAHGQIMKVHADRKAIPGLCYARQMRYDEMLDGVGLYGSLPAGRGYYITLEGALDYELLVPTPALVLMAFTEPPAGPHFMVAHKEKDEQLAVQWGTHIPPHFNRILCAEGSLQCLYLDTDMEPEMTNTPLLIELDESLTPPQPTASTPSSEPLPDDALEAPDSTSESPGEITIPDLGYDDLDMSSLLDPEGRLVRPYNGLKNRHYRMLMCLAVERLAWAQVLLVDSNASCACTSRRFVGRVFNGYHLGSKDAKEAFDSLVQQGRVLTVGDRKDGMPRPSNRILQQTVDWYWTHLPPELAWLRHFPLRQTSSGNLLPYPREGKSDLPVPVAPVATPVTPPEQPETPEAVQPEAAPTVEEPVAGIPTWAQQPTYRKLIPVLSHFLGAMPVVVPIQEGNRLRLFFGEAEEDVFAQLVDPPRVMLHVCHLPSPTLIRQLAAMRCGYELHLDSKDAQ